MKLELKNNILFLINKDIKIGLLEIKDFKNDAFLELNYNNSFNKTKLEINRLKNLKLIKFRNDDNFTYALKFESKDIIGDYIFKKLYINSDNYNNFIITIN